MNSSIDKWKINYLTKPKQYWWRIIVLKIPVVLEWIIIGVLIFSIFRGITFPISQITSTAKSFLPDSISSDSSTVFSIEDNSRYQILLNVVHEHISMAEQNDISINSLRMQGRLLFVTFFAALITLIVSIKDERSRIIISVIVSIFGLFWYGINVHVIDIENRGQIPKQMLYNTEFQLLNYHGNNIHSYYLDFEKIETAFKEAESGHRCRKIKSFFTPVPEQIVFNLLPILLLLILSRLYKLKKE